MTSSRLTVLVVSRGLDALLKHCLAALDQALLTVATGLECHVVIVDNGSEVPYSAMKVSNATTELVRFDVGVSFARANNHAARLRSSDFYLLLNNDVFLDAGTIADMLRVVQGAPSVGVCGTRLLFPDGTLQHCGVVFGAGARGPYHRLRGQPGQAGSQADGEWQAVTGACMLVRGAVWEGLAGLDESYPFGLEDIDFCLRARRQGWRVYCCNRTESLHFESMTPGRAELDVASRRLFMRRWRGRYAIDG